MDATTNLGTVSGYLKCVAPVEASTELRAWDLAKIALGPNASAADLMTRTLQIKEIL